MILLNAPSWRLLSVSDLRVTLTRESAVLYDHSFGVTVAQVSGSGENPSGPWSGPTNFTMIISSRRDAKRMSARKTTMLANLKITPLIRQGLRVPFIDPPLSSPGLPLLFSRRKVKPPRPRLLGSWRFTILVVGCCLLFTWFATPLWCLGRSTDATPYKPQYTEQYEIVGSNVLPDVPGPVMVRDQKGRARWTILIQPDQTVPLLPLEYARICMEAEELSKHVAQFEKVKLRGFDTQRFGFHSQDKTYMDIAEAQRQGLLPSSNSDTNLDSSRVVGWERYAEPKNKNLPVCRKSLVFVLQSEDGGFGAMLMGLWMSYGLAKKEGRAFFVDDTNWGYGDYTTFFKSPPMPDCRPPPVHLRVPFPSQAQHLLISPSTYSWVFDRSFSDRFEDGHRSGIHRQKPVFTLLRTGYEALFRLTDQDHVFLERRVKQLKEDREGVQIGVHIRRGDRHPLEPQYENSYIPLDVYAEKAEQLARMVMSVSLSSAQARATTVLASDDPDVYLSPEFKHAQKAQTFISLASKSALETISKRSKQNIDSHSGWEGGFFNNLFWSLGSPSPRPVARHSPPPSKYPASKDSHNNKQRGPSPTEMDDTNELNSSAVQFRFRPPTNALRLREFVARAYLLDIAVLGSTDAVVCGISSISCRLLAVQLGWEKAIKQRRWMNVDGSLSWQGFIW